MPNRWISNDLSHAVVQFGLNFLNLPVELSCPLILLSVGWNMHDGKIFAEIAITTCVEEGQEPVVLGMVERCVGMGMTLHAAECRSEPDLPRCVNTIDDGGDAEFFIVGAAFGVRLSIPVKRGCDQIVIRWQWQQISRELDRDKVIIRHIGSKGLDDPIPPGPVISGEV